MQPQKLRNTTKKLKNSYAEKKRKETGSPCFFSEFTIVGLSNELQKAAKTRVVSVTNDSERKTQLNRYLAFKPDVKNFPRKIWKVHPPDTHIF